MAINATIPVSAATVGDFGDTARAKELALGLFAAGAGVLYSPAGAAGSAGVVEAAVEHRQSSGAHKWVIGVDEDMKASVPEAQGGRGTCSRPC